MRLTRAARYHPRTLPRLQADLLCFVHTDKFSAAESTFWDMQKALQKDHHEHGKVFFPSPKDNATPALSPNKITPTSAFLLKDAVKAAKLLDAFSQIQRLLGNASQCIELLKELDQKIAKFEPYLGDFTKIKPGDGFFLNAGIRVPNEPLSSLDTLVTNAGDLLHYLIRKKLQAHQIETQDDLNTFSGYVKSDFARNSIQKGILFNEQFLMNNSILHGIYAHYVQWYLFAAAVEKEILHFQNGITLRDVMTAMVSTDFHHSPWSAIIDFAGWSDFNEHYLRYNLGEPFRLNSLLLFAEEIPHLRGCYLNDFYTHILKFQKQFTLQFPDKNEIPYVCIVGAQAVAYNDFGVFDIGFTADTVKAHLGEVNCAYEEIDTSDAMIITQSAPIKFKQLSDIEKSLLCPNPTVNINHSIWREPPITLPFEPSEHDGVQTHYEC